ncbi:MAG: hypothetical protein H6834_16595 [Planctomycetes bacterium]|nr:hypothetical protein [Planctomycetota bacterium]
MRKLHRGEVGVGASGFALIGSLFALFLLAGFAFSLVTVTTSSNKEQLTIDRSVKLWYLAEAACQHAVIDLGNGGSGNVGSSSVPVAFGHGAYWAVTTDNGDGTYTTTGVGSWGGERISVQALIGPASTIFSSAMYAGNRSEDPNYTLEFGGTGTTADLINGDIYSGGNITVSGDADMNGSLIARGAVTGATGITGVSQPPPDISAMHYETDHDVDVAAEFTANQTWKSDDAGGNAYQVPEEFASHIFRKNPSDRSTEVNSTPKNDYFLEDPYETVRRDVNWDGTDAYEITLSGMGTKGPNSTDMVYYIDGNLWIHNLPTYSFKLVSRNGDPVRVTLVVKGNIYISDNIFYEDPSRDALALIAIQDDLVPDSGNIYFGDPRAGTLETMNAFMYAENDFYDNNLNSSGAANIIVNGTMSAGNHVSIQRDFTRQRSRFELNHDARLENGTVQLPRIPKLPGAADFKIWGIHDAAR